MPTTKVRVATPMKNKTALWRKMAKKHHDGTLEIRTGRRLRDALNGVNHQAFPHEIVIGLMKRAEIATPVFDKNMAAMHNQPQLTEESLNTLSIGNGAVVDAEVIQVSAPFAAA